MPFYGSQPHFPPFFPTTWITKGPGMCRAPTDPLLRVRNPLSRAAGRAYLEQAFLMICSCR